MNSKSLTNVIEILRLILTSSVLLSPNNPCPVFGAYYSYVSLYNLYAYTY